MKLFSYCRFSVVWVSVALVLAVEEAAGSLSLEQTEFFESRIRPILAQDCYECHSVAGKQKGGLLLDHRAGWQAGGNGGPVIVPGKPEESRLLWAIRHDEETLAMPKSGAKLEEAVIADFVRWIRMGAPDPRDKPPSPEQIQQDQDWESVLQRRKSWWSFQPIVDSIPPESEWSSHPVDRFLEAQRQAEGLEAVGPADANVLARRLYFALIGLPPTAEQVRTFLQAHEEDPARAVEALADKLLASPHFGERWARHWMDWIRYAESHGSEGDPQIGNAHLYRDYLIRALNADVPYDQLLREHVAGDQLQPPRVNKHLAINESLIGTAHWRMVFHGFAPTDALDEKVRFTDDQINVFSKAFMGLTVSCARCHDHKFDPISQKDYYALFGILGSTRPGRKAIDLPEKQNLHRAELAALKPQILAAVAEDWIQFMPEFRQRLAAESGLVKSAESKDDLLHPLRAIDQEVADGKAFSEVWSALTQTWKADRRQWREHLARDYPIRWRLDQEEDCDQWFAEGAGLATGASRAGDFSVAPKGDSALSGIYPGGVFTHLHSAKHGGRFTSPDFRLDGDYEAWMRVRGDHRSMSRYVVHNYPRSGTVYPVRELRGDKGAKWHWERYSLDYWNGEDVHLEIATAGDAPLLVKNEPRSWFGIREVVVLKQGSPTPPQNPINYLNPVFQIAEESAPANRKQAVNTYAAAVEKAVNDWKAGRLSDAQAELLDLCLRHGLLPNSLAQLPSAKPLLENYRRLESAVPVPARIPTVAEWTAQDQPLFDRGNHKKPLEKVPRRFLEAIDDTPYQTKHSGRLQLAEDLLRADNPLPRRVIVNRIWHHLFGKGLVRTPDNFGRLGNRPTHPQLLDHLATRFAERDQWSIKRMIRYLITTRTWQLSGKMPTASRLRDPANDLLSHANIRRLEAESIRDSLLQVSGMLDLRPPAKPIAGNQPNRSVYMSVIRNRMDPFLSLFDAPVPFSAQGRRNVTTVPGQSLAMMNSDFVANAAQQWGSRLRLQAEQFGVYKLIDSAWQRAFARRPTPQERRQTADFIARQKDAYEKLAAAISKQKQSLEILQSKQTSLRQTARERLGGDESASKNNPAFLKPISQWLFDEDGRDDLGLLHASLEGDARIENGALVLDGKTAFARSVPLTADLAAKTLEVWLQLDDLEQRGGGALSVQMQNGAVFDAIVFGERQPGRWILGSDGFTRTQDFGGPREKQALEKPIHLAITCADDGTITGYRNGELYGKPYRASKPPAFRARQSEVLFGLRHGQPAAGRLLKGKILEVRLYDRALAAKEVAAAANRNSRFVSERDLLSVLSEAEQNHWRQWIREIATLQKNLSQMESSAPKQGEDEVWTDLALAIFNMKEFIYVR